MKSDSEIQDKIGEILQQVKTYEAYRDVCIAKHDRHGVMDAEADMREMESRVAALRWCLAPA